MKKITFLLLLFVGFSNGLKAQIVANNDFLGGIGGDPQDCMSGITIPVDMLLSNDIVNGSQANRNNVIFTIVSGSSPFWTVDYDSVNGFINVYTSTQSYDVTFNYQICDIANQSNCATTTVVIPVYHGGANSDSFNLITSDGGTTPSVLVNDYYRCFPVLEPNPNYGGQILNTDIYWGNSPSSGFIFNTNGTITVEPGVLPGNYTFNYYKQTNGDYSNQTQVNVTITQSLQISVNDAYQDYNGDGITNVGDVINYQYNITNDATSALTNVNVTAPNTSITGTIATLSGGETNTTSITGVYAITQQDINSGFVEKTAIVTGLDNYNHTHTKTTLSHTNLNINSGIKLNAFYDTNNNGIQDTGEVNLNFGEFHYELNNNGITNNLSSNNGIAYLYETNPANTYNLGYTLNPDFATNYSVTPSTYSNVSVANDSGITAYNFPIRATTVIKDLKITTIALTGNPRPGFTHTIRLKYENLGNQTVDYSEVGLIYPNNFTFINSTISPYYTSTGEAYFDVNEILPFSSGYIDIVLQVPTIPTVNLNDQITIISGITDLSFPTEVNFSNNENYLYQRVVGSYDPNDKNENHTDKIVRNTYSINDKFTYTIRFENTGNANAINVKVNDVLDTKLNLNTFRVIDASHSYKTERIGNNVSFKFDGINLPPSVANTATGKGFITYEVEVNPSIQVGDIVSNTANIFFDFNPAIVTNTVDREFVTTLSTNNFNKSSLKLYPNPANSTVSIESENTIDFIEITDINGRIIHKQRIDAKQDIINVENLTNGIYFIKLQSNQDKTIIKFIKN